jgi:hypothetical protein
MLSDSEKESLEDVVCWILEGAVFKVHEQDQFVETILPRYFKMTKYNSFTRQLHAYDFTWIEKGQQRGGVDVSKLCVPRCGASAAENIPFNYLTIPSLFLAQQTFTLTLSETIRRSAFL